MKKPKSPTKSPKSKSRNAHIAQRLDSLEASEQSTPAATQQVTYLSLSDLALSPFNYRKLSGLDEESLADLSASIRQQGIITPLIVRPLSASRWEVISGERRYKAAELAVVPAEGQPQFNGQLPCLIREATEAQARELQIIENLQRVDISPMEEAQGFQDLLDQRDADGQPLHTLESVAARIGKSTRTLRNRLKLLVLPPEVQDAVISGKCCEAIATLIVTIPDPMQQANFAREVLSPFSVKADGLSKILDDNQEPKSVRQAKSHLAFAYQKRLKDCKFDQTDPDLVPIETAPDGERIAGGACADCPWRSGNIEGAASADVCTNTACFRRKETADTAKVKSLLKEEGVKLLTGNKAPMAVTEDGEVGTASDSEYVALDEVVPGKRNKTWKEVLEAAPAEAPTPDQYAVKQGGKIVHLIKRTDAVSAAAAANIEIKLPPPQVRPPHEPTDYEKERAERQATRLKRQRVRDAALPQIIAAVEAGDPLTWLRHAFAESSVHADIQARREWSKLDDAGFAAAMQALTLPELAGLVFECALGVQAVGYDGEWSERFLRAAKLTGVNLKQVEKALGKPSAEPVDLPL